MVQFGIARGVQRSATTASLRGIVLLHQEHFFPPFNRLEHQPLFELVILPVVDLLVQRALLFPPDDIVALDIPVEKYIVALKQGMNGCPVQFVHQVFFLLVTFHVGPFA